MKNDLKDKILEKINFRTFYQKYFNKLGEVNEKGEVQCLCPFHTDRDPSLSINMQTGLFKCFGCGASGDVFNFYTKIHRINFKTTLERMAKELGIESSKGLGELQKAYDYKDADGKTAFQVCRFENKQIRLRQPDGSGGWVWNVKGIEPIPYNLPSMIEAHTVYVCEGEKDADTLIDLGLCATTNTNGAGNWKLALNEHFRGKRVVIIPDNDQPGRDHAELVAHNLANYADTIKIVELPGLPEKGDVTDWLQTLSTGSKIRKQLCFGCRVTLTAIWEPSAEVKEQGIQITSVNALMNTDFPPMLEIIGNGVLPEGCGLMLAGEAKTGKSLMVLEWSIRFAMGWPLFDGLIPVPKARRVLFFQAENPERQVQFRLKRMVDGLGIAKLPDSIFFADRSFRYDLQDPECLQMMIDGVKQVKADVFVIDPLSSFHNADENENVPMRNVLDGVTAISIETGAASVVVHHFGKPQPDQQEKDRTRGASSIQGWYDTHCTLVNRKHESKVLRVVTFGPLRHGPEPKPILIERDENFISHVTEAEMLITPKQVQDFLNEKFGGEIDTKTKLIRGLIDGFDCSDSTAHRAINEAVEMGLVKTVKGHGKSKKYKAVSVIVSKTRK